MSCVFCNVASDPYKATAEEAFITGFMTGITTANRVEVLKKALDSVCERHGNVVATFVKAQQEVAAETKRSAS